MNNYFELSPSSPNNFPKPNQTLLEAHGVEFIMNHVNQENERISPPNSVPTCADSISTLIRQPNYYIDRNYIGRMVGISPVQYSPKDREYIKNHNSNKKCVYNLGHWVKEENEAFYRGCQIYGWGRWKKIHQNLLPKRSLSQIRSHAQKIKMRIDQIDSNSKEVAEVLASMPSHAQMVKLRTKKIHQNLLTKRSLSQIRSHAQNIKMRIDQTDSNSKEVAEVLASMQSHAQMVKLRNSTEVAEVLASMAMTG